ncbi:MAG: LemA family protein [Prevotellaceae bacterium]|jgi:hypothetical protein|nr:LemA family protein [Prevotellaceae bacterium]
MDKIKIALAGNSDNLETYMNVLTRHNEDVVLSGAWFHGERPENYSGSEFASFEQLIENSDAIIFLGNKIRNKIISDSVKACKHIFVETYDLIINSKLKSLYKLVIEAWIVAQVSFPKIYYWGIEYIAYEYPVIRNIFFNREYLHLQQRHEPDIVENYPDIKAGEQFINLQVSLNECEVQLAAARRTYNSAVMDYNNALEMFPSSIVATFMKYKRKAGLRRRSRNGKRPTLEICLHS